MALEVEHGLPPVMIDPVQFQQVLLNLIVNAAESYREPGGTVTVSLKREEARLKLEVADHGCGMDRATRERMFDPYFTTKPGGHGLGLAAVKGVVDKFGGQLGCRSETGQGTTFTLWFDTTTLDMPSSRVVTPMPPEQRVKAVLVVDDDDL